MIELGVSLDDGVLRFRVADTGVGMDPGEVAGLFNPFHQADGSNTRRFGGAGLGLAISKRLAESLGGDITVESRRGHGSVFTLCIPYAVVQGKEGSRT